MCGNALRTALRSGRRGLAWRRLLAVVQFLDLCLLVDDEDDDAMMVSAAATQGGPQGLGMVGTSLSPDPRAAVLLRALAGRHSAMAGTWALQPLEDADEGDGARPLALQQLQSLGAMDGWMDGPFLRRAETAKGRQIAR
jgi:hypothetical protein